MMDEIREAQALDLAAIKVTCLAEENRELRHRLVMACMALMWISGFLWASALLGGCRE